MVGGAEEDERVSRHHGSISDFVHIRSAVVIPEMTSRNDLYQKLKGQSSRQDGMIDVQEWHHYPWLTPRQEPVHQAQDQILSDIQTGFDPCDQRGSSYRRDEGADRQLQLEHPW